MNEITLSELLETFSYREDGNLVRIKPTTGPSGFVGSVVGFVNTDYSRKNKKCIATKIGGKQYLVHRLIYMYHYGFMPEVVDHINRNCLDNRIENLRAADPSSNSSNRKVFSNNTSGHKGVSWDKGKNRWIAYVDVKRKRKHLGYFTGLEEAASAAVAARDHWHGVFAAHS